MRAGLLPPAGEGWRSGCAGGECRPRRGAGGRTAPGGADPPSALCWAVACRAREGADAYLVLCDTFSPPVGLESGALGAGAGGNGGPGDQPEWEPHPSNNRAFCESIMDEVSLASEGRVSGGTLAAREPAGGKCAVPWRTHEHSTPHGPTAMQWPVPTLSCGIVMLTALPCSSCVQAVFWDPWFSCEQQYTLYDARTQLPLGEHSMRSSALKCRGGRAVQCGGSAGGGAAEAAYRWVVERCAPACWCRWGGGARHAPHRNARVPAPKPYHNPAAHRSTACTPAARRQSRLLAGGAPAADVQQRRVRQLRLLRPRLGAR